MTQAPVTSTTRTLPTWAQQMRQLFISGSVSQFIVHGNVFDLVSGRDASGNEDAGSLREFLDKSMFSNYDVVLHYDRGRGIRASKGEDDWSRWLEDAFGRTTLKPGETAEPGAAMELLDRYLLRSLNLQAVGGGGASVPRRIAVVIHFAEFVVPRGDPLNLGGNFSANIVKVLGWANDPNIQQSNIATVLVSEGLGDINELVRDNPHVAQLRIDLPDEQEMGRYVQSLARTKFPDLEKRCEVSMDVLKLRLTGLSHVAAYRAIATALSGEGTITAKWLSGIKKAMIERECQGLLEFMESTFTLDNVAGHTAAKQWLREDGQLLSRGLLNALPMGYLVTGRIGTGKTFLVRCWAGELGVPCVVFKNFRDKWVGATESNLEKIFAILRALGQVVVFVDEADQITGKRGGGDGDSGLSGRVYAMLAAEMSNTDNRGRIIWVFATSRPDLLEVDLKRQGRLDVHIPLFPPQNADEVRALMIAIARKLKLPLGEEDIPPIPEAMLLGGNEIEGTLMRVLRTHNLAAEPRPRLRDVLAQVMGDVRASSHTMKLEYMDMIAVKECTDQRFLPARYATITPGELEAKLDELRGYI